MFDLLLMVFCSSSSFSLKHCIRITFLTTTFILQLKTLLHVNSIKASMKGKDGTCSSYKHSQRVFLKKGAPGALTDLVDILAEGLVLSLGS